MSPTAQELGKKIAQDPDWKWRAGMSVDSVNEGGWRLIAEVSPGKWLACIQNDEGTQEIVKDCFTPRWPNVLDPVTRLWMKDFAPRQVGDWLYQQGQ